jgi:hypothetical protein
MEVGFLKMKKPIRLRGVRERASSACINNKNTITSADVACRSPSVFSSSVYAIGP